MESSKDVNAAPCPTACSLSRPDVQTTIGVLKTFEKITKGKAWKYYEDGDRIGYTMYEKRAEAIHDASVDLTKWLLDNPEELCEHGVVDGEYCQPCNAEYKRAAACDGQD